jgi:hypothetical protein
MPTVKQLLVGTAIAIAVAILAVGAVGSAIENSATQVATGRLYTSAKAFRLSDHQRLRKVLLGQDDVELPLR